MNCAYCDTLFNTATDDYACLTFGAMQVVEDREERWIHVANELPEVERSLVSMLLISANETEQPSSITRNGALTFSTEGHTQTDYIFCCVACMRGWLNRSLDTLEELLAERAGRCLDNPDIKRLP